MSFQKNGNSLNGRNRNANSTIAYQLMRSQNIHNAPDAKFLLKTETCVHQQMTYQNIRNALMTTNRNEKSTAVCQLMSAHLACNVPSARDRNEN
jgi:hypothetical protein